MMMNKMSKRHTIMKSLFATIASVLMLAAASIAQAQPFAYIPNNGSNNVSVINTVTNIVVATVPVGSLPVGVAVNPGGARVYITNSSGNSVSVIDTATNTVTATVPVGAFPQGVALNPAGTRVYVANNAAGNVSVIDATNNTVVATVTVGTSPAETAVNPAGTRAYVTNSSASVSVIDTTNNTVVATIPLANSPGGIAVNPAGTRAYVTIITNTVAVIDTTNNTVLTTVAVGQAPRAVAVNPAGTLVYVTNNGGTIVSVINTSTNTVVATVPVGTAPRGVAINPAGTRAYVANQGSSSVSVIDTATNTVVATVPVGASPIAIGQFVGGPVPTVPGAPTAATAFAGDSQATVSYTPPAFNGGSTITTYTATSSPGGIQGFATGGPIIVNGLTNGTAYTFTVTATNGVGVGPPSTPSNSVTPAAALVACQFIPTAGAWIVPANWSNCASGNGVPAGTPGTANRADILGKTATLPTGTLNVGDINLSGTAVIQGTGLSTSTLNVVAAGATTWGIGSYTFQNMTVVFTGSFPVDARNGTLSVDNSVLVVSAPSSGIAAGAVTITGTGAKISNGGVFLLNTSLTMTAGGAFENNSGASFSPQAPITINGSFVNQGAFVTQAGFPIALANAATFSQPAASGLIVGDGIISAIGQVLTVANGVIAGSATFNVGTLGNTGAFVAPTSIGMIGTITVNGNYVSGPAASVNIKIAGGSVAPVFDKLVVSGTSTLTNGTANFAYIDAGFGPYVPVQGNTFNFITAAATAGTFSSFTFPPSGNVVSLTYTPTVVQFVVGAPVAPAITVAGITTFPSTAVGASSGVQAITITNSGTGTLTLNSITHSNASVFPDTLGGPAPNATHYCGFGSLAGGVPNTGVPINIAPAASCVLNLIFSPNAVGALSGSITVNSNAPTSPTAIALTGTGVAATTPSMTVTFAPATVAVNTNAALTLTLTNPTATSAFISSGSVSIPAGLTATAPASNTCGTLGTVGTGVYSFGMGFIPAMGSCTIVLTAQSATPGGYTVTIAPGALNAGGANTNTSAATLTVSALLPPTISFAVSPTSIAVGGTSVGTLTINNPNAVPLTANPVLFNYLPGLVNAPVPSASSTCAGASITATPGAGSYTQNTSFTLPPAGSCTFNVTITSNTAGTYSGNIAAGLIVTPAGSSNATPFNITVTPASAPAVTLTPPSVNFGTRTINTTSPAQVVTLTNSGTLNLVISSITGSGDFGFTSTCPLLTPPLVPGAQCVINVTFTPLTVAALSGTISITSNAPGSPNTIALSGTGVGVGVPNVSLAPATLNFGAQAINTSSFVGSVIVSNTGFANLILSSVSVSAPFSRVALAAPVPPDCGASLAPGSSCQIGVVFRPTAIGAQSGQISIIDNAAGSPRLVPLTGNGSSVAVPVISAIGALAFGDQIINNASAPQNLTISNTGAATLIISAITLTGVDAANFTLSGQSGCTSIAPAASCTLAITFLTTTAGAKTAQINITSNAQNAAVVSTTLTGNGILAPRAVVNVTTTTIGFGNVIFGGAAPNQVITLSNGGGQALTIGSIVLLGDFVQMNNCGASVAAQASCTLNIVFTPLAQGVRVGELILTTNAATSPNRIPLSGTGCRWFSQAQSRLFLTSC